MTYTCGACQTEHAFEDACPAHNDLIYDLIHHGRFEPLFDKIIVLPDPPTARAGLIHIPENQQNEHTIGTVIAVGPSIQSNLKPGDRIVYGKLAGIKYWTGKGYDFKLMRDNEAICRIK